MGKGEFMLGPIDYIVLGFRGNGFDGSIMRELSKAVDEGIIRVLDLVFVVKGADGTISEAEYADQSDDLKRTFGDFAIDPDLPLLSEQDIAKVGEQLDPDCAAGVLVIEHVWARNLKQAIANAGGFLVDDGRIHPEKIEAALAELQQTTTNV
jgi:hypothetical protein